MNSIHFEKLIKTHLRGLVMLNYVCKRTFLYYSQPSFDLAVKDAPRDPSRPASALSECPCESAQNAAKLRLILPLFRSLARRQEEPSSSLATSFEETAPYYELTLGKSQCDSKQSNCSLESAMSFSSFWVPSADSFELLAICSETMATVCSISKSVNYMEGSHRDSRSSVLTHQSHRSASLPLWSVSSLAGIFGFVASLAGSSIIAEGAPALTESTSNSSASHLWPKYLR